MSEKVHRLAKHYEELRRFPSDEQAKAAYKDWQFQLMRSPLFWLGLIAYSSTVAGLVMFLLFVIRQWVPIQTSLLGGIVGGIVGGSGVVTMTWFWRRRFRRFLRERLVSYGVPVCLVCGYDLRGLMEPRCPECGSRFEPGLLDDHHEHLA